MTKEELIQIFTNRVVALSQAKNDAINMGDIDRVLTTDAQLQLAEKELNNLQKVENPIQVTVDETAQNTDESLNLETEQFMFLTLLQSQGGPPPVVVVDSSDVLKRQRKHQSNQLSQKEEEQIAAQLLKARAPKQPSTEDRKKALEWKRLVFEKINGATTEQELEAVNTVPTESVEVTAAVLAEVERQKEAKRLELEIVRREAELKAAEFDAQLKANEEALYAKLEEQRQALIAAKQLQLETLARHQLAIDAALEQERQALLLAEEADKQAAEFNRKREQRLKRIKALMLLAKLDL